MIFTLDNTSDIQLICSFNRNLHVHLPLLGHAFLTHPEVKQHSLFAVKEREKKKKDQEKETRKKENLNICGLLV